MVNATKASAKKTKKELLAELESIKGILLTDSTEKGEIPIIQSQPVEQAALELTTPELIISESTVSETETEPESFTPQQKNSSLYKASGENPFLPQHIRERLRGNNPIPSYEFETAQKIINVTKSSYGLNSDVVVNNFSAIHKSFLTKSREHLVEDVVKSLKPQIEAELRQRLAIMPVEELEELLSESGD